MLAAFEELLSCRPGGSEPGAIPWSAVVHYGERAGLDEESIDALLYLVRALETAFRKWTRDEAALMRSLKSE